MKPVRIHVISDLHAEKGGGVPLPPAETDLVVWAGDIHQGNLGLFAAAESQVPILYVAGNHEHYGSRLPSHVEQMKDLADTLRVHFLENRSLILHGIRFLGCTLWTDFDLFGTEQRADVSRYAREEINDFRLIRRSHDFQTFTPEDAREIHQRSRFWLESELARPFTGPTVVITHHAPSLRSVKTRYRKSPSTGAFTSSLDDLVEQSHAALWIHGHTHHCVDYQIGRTRVLSNQRGYLHEPDPDFRPDLLVSLTPRPPLEP